MVRYLLEDSPPHSQIIIRGHLEMSRLLVGEVA
jgi:hypothetical protein